MVFQSHVFIRELCSSRKYPYSPQGRFIVLHPPSPQEIPVYYHTLLQSKNLAFKTPPLPLGISNDLLWGGYRYFFRTTHWEEIILK